MTTTSLSEDLRKQLLDALTATVQGGAVSLAYDSIAIHMIRGTPHVDFLRDGKVLITVNDPHVIRDGDRFVITGLTGTVPLSIV